MIPPIVMLHHVSDDPSYDSLKPYCISRKSFVQLLDYIQLNEFQTLDFSDINGQQKHNSKKIILTFDDCAKHLFDFAIPELIKRKMKAIFYMPTAHMGLFNSWDVAEGRKKIEIMNAEDIRELSELGMEVAAHSHHHIKLKEINSESELKFEAEEYKNIIESITQKKINSFAYPFGSVPSQFNYKKILSATGYSFAVSIYQAFENKLALRRFIYHDGDTTETLKKKLSWQYKCYRFATDPLKKY